MIRNPKRLLELAYRLPQATTRDLHPGNTLPADANPHDLRCIDNAEFRVRLVTAKLAQVIQSPRGRQRLTTIIRIFPHANAPSAMEARAAPRPAPAIAKTKPTDLPTVEELNTLVLRILSVEREVSESMQGEIIREIAALKKSIATLNGLDLENAADRLRALLAQRHELGHSIRERAFARIADDTTFGPRRYLRMLRIT